MLWRSDKGKSKAVEQTKDELNRDESIDGQSMSREEFFAQNEDARKVFEDIMSLRKSVETLKAAENDTDASADIYKMESISYTEETEDVIAAKQAILEQAKRDAVEEKARRDEAIRKEEMARQEQQRILEAQRRVAMIEEEAERRRQEAIEAERHAKEVSRKIALNAMEAERQAKNESDDAGDHKSHRLKQQTATREQLEEFFDGRLSSMRQEADLEMAKQALLSAQKEQNIMLDLMSHAAEMDARKLTQEQQESLKQQQKLLREEQFKLGTLLGELKSRRLESIEQERIERELRLQQDKIEQILKAQEARAAKAERARRLREEEAAREAEKAERLRRKQALQAEKLALNQKRKEERIRRAKERELLKKARKEEAARAKLARMKLEEKSKADAELGGGIVNVQGVTITTEIKEVSQYTWKDFLGLARKKERSAATESEKQELKEAREKRTEEARALVDQSIKKHTFNYRQSKFGQRMAAFKAFCDRRKAPLLTAFAVMIMVSVGIAGVVNYFTAYSYSYNGQQLGIVREKDDVLRITDLVQNALTTDKDIDVVIDAKDDIQFERVSVLGEDVKFDTSEDVLKRLTYMGNLNVKAFGIYVNGDKVGAVESKEVAAEVLQEIKDKYTSHMEGSVIEEAVIIEDVEVRKSNTDLQDIASKDEMVDILCTSGQKETTHEVIVGETLADLTKLYSMTEEEILAENPGVDPKKLEVGSKLIIKQEAPILTVKITEMVTYQQEIDFEVQEQPSQDIYEGYSQLQQEGEPGLNEVTARIVLVNGERIEEQPLVTTVKKAPVPEVILVGAKDRPPTVGSGTFIYPLTASYTLSSGFGMRWGSLHTGVDMALPVGNVVVASDGGTVTQAGYSGGYGYLIIIDHQNGMETYYAHNSELLVSTGDKVFQGQQIAWSGNSGRSTGPHLHFEIRVNGSPQDPMNYLP